MKEALNVLKLNSFAKTSGSRGVHIMVPICDRPDASEVLAFAEAVAARVAAAHPKELTVAHSIAARRGRVYLDPFRNGFGQSVAAPYSVRRRLHAPISTPLAWSELSPSLIQRISISEISYVAHAVPVLGMTFSGRLSHSGMPHAS